MAEESYDIMERQVTMDRDPVHSAYSINGVPIRLTDERWFHIVENHDDLAGYFFEILDAIEKPDFVLRGNNKTLKAIRNMARRKILVVIYRELSADDGFVITAYFLESAPKGEVLWHPE